MKKQRKQFVIMLVLFTFLVVAYSALGKYNEEQEKEEENTEVIVVTDLDYEDIVAFSYDYNDETYTFSKSNNEWTYDAKPGFDVDESRVEDMLNVACGLMAEDYFDVYESLDNYGLDTPQKIVKLGLIDGSVVQILLGNYNEMTDTYYLMVEDDSNLYIVDETLLDTFDVSYTDLEYVEEETETISEETEQ